MASVLSRRVLTYVATAAAGFLLAYFIVAFFVFPSTAGEADIAVPGVIGLTQGDAQRRLNSAGLVATLGEERFSADAPKSTVLSQTPAAGESVPRGSKVALDVSAGQQRSVIPAVTGMTQGDAGTAIKNAGLVVGQISEERSDSTRGLVLDSRPAAGQGVPAGTRVDLVVSAGRQELTMPDVVGRDEESATVLLRQLGFTVKPVERDDFSNLPAGTVVSQSPAAGTSVSPSASVTLKVSARQ
jgi:eukaryotic-like serine/threonine-protein kinase